MGGWLQRLYRQELKFYVFDCLVRELSKKKLLLMELLKIRSL